MTTWQRIFAEKAASLKLMDPWTFQEDNSLQVHSLKPGWTEFLQNHVSGRFQCSQCLYKWSSAKVHILFHMCYGMVLMRIFRQACRQCHEPQLEEPIFSLENIERLLHNLVLKILEDFYNVPMQSADLLEVVVDGCHASGPHDRTHCEGCRLGVCSRSRAAMEPSAGKNKAGVSKAQKTKMDVDKAQKTKKEVDRAWKIKIDVDEAWKTEMDADKAQKTKMDVDKFWKTKMGVDKAQKTKIDVDKARKTKVRMHKAWKPMEDMDNAALITSSPEQVTGGGFPWKRCCCVGLSVLCVLAVLIFALLYFLLK
ncbi:receptor-transporting protein 2-like [Meleagris gallopavo]|uniref:receptor-transporting protein 2-like n=1 Tax=Meleagris gallopavo TaxID=9103 RepID=UPI000549D706|nr:receptor-transporting protein 2-like [Meleagris gallopavo]